MPIKMAIVCNKSYNIFLLVNNFFSLNFQEGNIPLFAAIKSGNFSITEELLKEEIEKQLSYQSKNIKDTALHLAARNQDNDMAKLFIKLGAEVDSQNVRNQISFYIEFSLEFYNLLSVGLNHIFFFQIQIYLG